MSALAEEVQSWLEARADDMAELLTRLVAVNTENPPGRGLGQCARLLSDAMGELGVSPELIPVLDNGDLEEPYVVRGSVGAGSELIYFHGHFDVVPAQNPAQFVPERREGRITGRGSADMKGGLVSMLYGAAAAASLGLIDTRRIVFHFVCDEETGSTSGSGYLSRTGLIDPSALAMLTAEPTGGAIWHASRGAITLRVKIAGREAHVGYAHKGASAFEYMLQIAEPLIGLAQQLRAQQAASPGGSHDSTASTLVVGGQAEAGVAFNVVPASAWFTVDGRFNPKENLDTELSRLTDIIHDKARSVGAEVEIDVLQSQPSASTDQCHPTAHALADCIAAVQGNEPEFRTCPGVLDTRWYSQLGIPAFGYGAGRLDVSHGPREFIDEAAMRRCAAVCALFAAHQKLGGTR